MQQRRGKEGKGEVGKVWVNNFIGEENFALIRMKKNRRSMRKVGSNPRNTLPISLRSPMYGRHLD